VTRFPPPLAGEVRAQRAEGASQNRKGLDKFDSPPPGLPSKGGEEK
jgi:hypothetical protein